MKIIERKSVSDYIDILLMYDPLHDKFIIDVDNDECCCPFEADTFEECVEVFNSITDLEKLDDLVGS